MTTPMFPTRGVIYQTDRKEVRRGSSPILNEMILFLKENKDLWGVEDVHQANLNRLSANKNLRVEKKMAEHAEMMANNN